jgi:hypothetical protein
VLLASAYGLRFQATNFDNEISMGLSAQNSVAKMGAILNAEVRIALLLLGRNFARESRFQATGRLPPVLFLGRNYLTSPQNLGANVFAPSPSRAPAIC